MGAKRAKRGCCNGGLYNCRIDKASKLDADTKSTLEGFKGSAPAATPVAAAPVAAALLTLILSQSILSKIKRLRNC